MAKSTKQGGKKGRKYGRNRVKCERYAATHRRVTGPGGLRAKKRGGPRKQRAVERTPH